MAAEKEAIDLDSFTPDEARNFEAPTDRFYCKISDNTYNIKFRRYKIRDIDSGYTLVDINDEDAEDSKTEGEEPEPADEDRLLRYQFGPDFLLLRTIGTELTFSVGDKPVKNLVMIERHYFKDKLIKSFEFNFKFCIPNTTNSWEVIYDMPDLTDEEKKDIISSPWETKSDSFFFVQNRLVMHTRAIYDYSPFDD